MAVDVGIRRIRMNGSSGFGEGDVPGTLCNWRDSLGDPQISAKPRIPERRAA